MSKKKGGQAEITVSSDGGAPVQLTFTLPDGGDQHPLTSGDAKDLLLSWGPAP
jgi:hypothetical protein